MQLTDNTKQSYAVEEYGASKEFDTMKFTEKLRALRRARCISQRALAMAAGIDHTYLSKIENEKLTFFTVLHREVWTWRGQSV